MERRDWENWEIGEDGETGGWIEGEKCKLQCLGALKMLGNSFFELSAEF